MKAIDRQVIGFLTSRSKKKNIEAQNQMKEMDENRLNQRKNEIDRKIMRKRIKSTFTESKERSLSNKRALMALLEQQQSTKCKLEFILSMINSEEISKTEDGLTLMKMLLNNEPVPSADFGDYIKQIVNRFLFLLFNRRDHIDDREHYLFQCTILKRVIRLSRDYECAMIQVVQMTPLRQLFGYYHTELERNNLRLTAGLLCKFMRLFANIFNDESQLMKTQGAINVHSTLLKSIQQIFHGDTVILMQKVQNDLHVNLILMIVHWLMLVEENQMKQYESISIFLLDYFVNELPLESNLNKSPVVPELFEALLLLSRRRDCIPLFVSSKASSQLIQFISRYQSNPIPSLSQHLILSLKIISNILGYESSDPQAILEAGFHDFIQKSLLSVNSLPHDDINEALVFYSCQSISNLILSKVNSAFIYVRDKKILQALRDVIASYSPQCRLEALCTLFIATHAQNVHVSTGFYLTGIHLFLIEQLKGDFLLEKECVLLALQTVEQILSYGETMNMRQNCIKLECEHKGFDNILCKLVYDEDKKISSKAKYILEIYWDLGEDLIEAHNYLLSCLQKK